MELRIFIKTTLLDIVNAVKDAQKEVGDSTIVPGGVASHFKAVELGISHLQTIDFEVAVEVDESKGSEGKLGVVSSFIGAGVAGKSSADKRQSNILKFRIPVQLPTSGLLKLDGK
ncbi:MAG: hypothetical protein KJ826_17620 [Proteobacteria bacterium]|nr:hypothetical protein [Pseudomonadota bacterium]MBU4036950.1 hypothetical protein [Pseudomonadota bacterium]